MRGALFLARVSESSLTRLVAVGVAATLVLSLGAGGNVLPPDMMSAAKVETPKQRSGSAKGKSHEVSAQETSAGKDKTEQMSRRPKGAPALERPYTPQVVEDLKADREDPPQGPGVETVPEREPIKVTGFDAEKSVEDPAQRSRFGSRFKNPDGTWTARYGTRPVNYQAPDGSWHPIDSSLVPAGTGRYRNKADGSQVDVAARAAAEDLVLVGLGQGRRLGFGVSGAAGVQGQVQGDSIVYPGVRPDSDLKLRVLNGGSVKEEIVLRSPNAPEEWEFPLRTEGVTPRLAADGSVELVDAASTVVAHLPHGFMVDSKVEPRSGDPARSEAVTYALEQRGGQWVLKVSADRAWLADPARVFPVTVDPTTVWNYADTHDTYVQSGYGSSPYAEGEVKAGTYNGGSTKAATYLAFNQVDNELSHTKIYDVNLNVFNFWSYSCSAKPVTVHPVTQSWSQTGIAGYPGPSYGSALSSKSFAHGWIPEGGSSSSCPAKWESIDLGSAGDALVQGWVNGTKSNYGLTVRASTSSSSGWKKFASRETPNGPYLIITYSPYNATYAWAQTPPVVNPPVLNNQAGNVNVKVTNKGHEAWTAAAGYRLTYQVFDKSGNQVFHIPAETTMPQTVSYNETVTINMKINPLPPGTWTIKPNMTNTITGVLFSDWGVPRTASMALTVPDVPSQLTEMFPKNNYRVGTLQPELFAEAESVDAWPSANVSYQFTICAPPWIAWEWCESSAWQQTPKWKVPAGKLQWGKEYYWNVRVSDSGGAITDGPHYKLIPAVQQPAITSHLASPASPGQEFDQQVGNYTTTAVDANVASAGPPLSVARTYNSLDPRTSHAFGAGWTTRFDMKVVPDADGTGNVVVTYPDGQEVRFARNTDGTFAPPPARHATFAEVTGGGWKLMDKDSTTYLFNAAGKLTKVTDHRGRAQDLQYGTDGKLSTVTVTGGRSLTFTWSGNHVATVSTDPVDGQPLTWTYTYTGDTLTKVCPPTSTTACATYGYGSGSHYRSVVLDDNPQAYWRLNEASGTVAASAVGENLGTDSGTATNLSLGQTGALAGTGDKAAGFTGSSHSRVKLPDRYISREGGFLTVEAWFKTTGSGVILSYQNTLYGASATKYIPALYVGADGKLRGQMGQGTVDNIMTSAAAVNNGQWHHAVLSGQGATQTLYLDGQTVGTLAGTIDHNNRPYVFVGTGHTAPGWPQTPATRGWFDFTGEIDEVAIYDKPLGLPAVRDHYNARLAAQQLTTVTKPSGRVQATNLYDVGTDRLAQHTDAAGGTWQIGAPVFSGKIDDLRRTVTLTDPKQGTLSHVYEPLRGNRLLTETDQLGKTTTYGYDVNGQLGKITDANGNETNVWFDERGNKRYQGRCADADTCHAEFWNYYLNPDDVFDPRNDQLINHADGRTINPYNSPYTTVWEYDTFGQRITELWPPTDDHSFRGLNWSYTDGTEPAEGGGTQPAGLLKRRSKANGGTAETYFYYPTGDLAAVTDAAGKVTKYAYDAIGRVTSKTEITNAHPSGLVTTYAYDGRGNLLSSTAPGTANQISGVTHTPQTRFTYDADGNRLTETLADLTGGDPERTTTYTYTAHGQVETVTDLEGGQQTYGYDTAGARTSLTDQRGTHYTFTYTARGDLATRTLHDWTGNPDNPSPATDVVLDSYAYDPGGRQGSHTDAMGRTTTFTYYGDDRPAQTIATGAKVNDSTTPRDVVLEARTYDGAGNLTSLTTGGKHRVDYEYDQVGQLVAETVDPDGAARRVDYELDSDNNIIKAIRTGADSEREEITNIGYDAANLPVREAVENGDTELVTTISRDQRGLVTRVVDPRGNTEGADPAAYATTMRYDAAGQPIETLAPPVQVERNGATAITSRPSTRYGYNTAGEQTHATDPEGRTVTTAFDKAGRPVSTQQPSYTPPTGTAVTPATTMDYDAAGQLTEQTDARGGITRFAYDALGQLIRREEPQLANEGQPGKWRFTYDLAGEQLSATDPVGVRTEATYDDLGRQITQTQVERYPSPAAYTTRLGYDDAGNLTTRTRPAGDTTTYTTSGAGDPTAITDSLGHETTLAYDLAGRLTRVTDPRGASTITEYDLAGRQTGASDLNPAGNTLRTYGFGYDAAGNRTSQTNAEGHTTNRAYDPVGRLTKLTEPVTGTSSIETTFGYDAAGQRTRLTDGRGNATITTYNTLGLVEKVIEPRTTAHWDDASRTWTTSYDAAGNPVHEAKPGGVTLNRTFDELGRLTEQTGTGAAATTQAKRFGYDLAGRQLRVSGPVEDLLFTYNDRGQPITSISPDGRTSTFTYDANGRLTQRTDPAGQTTLTYNGEDQIATTADTITATTSTRGYDDAGRLTTITTNTGAATGQRTYGYDDLDRLTSDQLTASTGTPLAAITYGYDLDDQLTTKTTTGTAGAGTNTYAYDHAGRLTQWTNPASTQTDYGWDAAGNRTQAGATTYTYDERNRLTSDGTNAYTYTGRGTLKTIGATTQQFDAFDRLIHEGTLTYKYDALDRVAQRTESGTTTDFTYAGQENDVAAITNSGGTLTSGFQRTSDGDVLGIRHNGQPYAALSDQHDDLVALYNPNLTTLTGSTAYDPYGQQTAQTGATSPIGYQGEYTEPTNGRVNMHARWYTPTTANFASRDDWTLNPNPSIQANRYTYANGTPLNNTDPSGHYGQLVVGGVVLGARLSIMGYRAYKAYRAAEKARRAYELQAASRMPAHSAPGQGKPGWYGSPDARPRHGTPRMVSPRPRGGGEGGGGAPWQPRTGVIAPPPPPPSPREIQRILAKKARDTPAPRPPTKPGISETQLITLRDGIEAGIRTAVAVNDPTPGLPPLINQDQDARPDPSSGGSNGTGTDDDEDECVPVKDYGPPVWTDRAGRPMGIHARFCNKDDLKGGSGADKTIFPPGWPEKDGRTANPRIGRAYVYSRCHLLADSLGGNGKKHENLFTCFHSPFNDPNMKTLEGSVKDAVENQGQIVDYMVTPVYRRGQLVPSMVRMTARGTRPDGSPGLNFDKCLGNTRKGWITNGAVCGALQWHN